MNRIDDIGLFLQYNVEAIIHTNQTMSKFSRCIEHYSKIETGGKIIWLPVNITHFNMLMPCVITCHTKDNRKYIKMKTNKTGLEVM